MQLLDVQHIKKKDKKTLVEKPVHDKSEKKLNDP